MNYDLAARPRQNRVTPFGEIGAIPARGTLMGNCGRPHDEQGVIRRSFLGRRLLRWSAFGYDWAIARPDSGALRVLTPRSVVRTLAAGYAAGIHPSSQDAIPPLDTRYL